MSHSNDTLMLANVSRRGLLKGMAGASALVLAARWDAGFANEQAQATAQSEVGRLCASILLPPYPRLRKV